MSEQTTAIILLSAMFFVFGMAAMIPLVETLKIEPLENNLDLALSYLTCTELKEYKFITDTSLNIEIVLEACRQ